MGRLGKLVLVSLCWALSSVQSFHSPLSTLHSRIATARFASTGGNCQDVASESLPKGAMTLVSRAPGPPSAEEISDANIVKIVTELQQVDDAECNLLVWKCLGYDLAEGGWVAARVFPKWADKYPSPPDLIGVTRNFSPEVDKQVRQASMDLMRSIPRDYKGGVRNLEYVGFKGFKLSELTPTKTRRAVLVNWLVYYREKLHGKTIEQLREERAREAAAAPDVAALPSERQFQSKRLD